MIMAVPVLVAVVLHRQRRARGGVLVPMVCAAAPAVLAVVVLAVLNQARFGSPADFGYGLMITPPQLVEKLSSHGQFSLAYLAHNLHWVVLAPPRLVGDAASGLPAFPLLASDPRGMGIFFVTPAYLAMVLSLGGGRWKQPLVLTAWLSLVLICTPGWLYFNSGWVQWGGRFMVDAWPLFLLLTAIGLRHLPARLVGVLIVASLLSNLWAVLLTTLRLWPACVA
jgi:hypothetical protein